MRLLGVAGLLVWMAAAAASEEVRSPLAMTGRATKSGAMHVFEAEVKPGIADGETVRVRVYFVRRWEIPVGLREEGGPTHDEELVDVDKGAAPVTEGKATVTCGYSEIEPWPGAYRVLAWWGDAEVGKPEVACAAGDFSVGEMARLPELKAKVDRELYEDFARLDRVLKEFTGRWKTLGEAPDAGWAEWLAGARASLEKVKTRNARRRKAEIYWAEARGRQRIEWAMEKIEPLLTAGSLHLPVARGARPEAADLQERLDVAVDDTNHYMQFLEIGRIIDDGKVRDILQALDRLVQDAQAWRAKAAGDVAGWKSAAAAIRAGLLEQQMALTGELPEAWFSRTEAVQKSLLRLVSHVDAIAAGKPSGDWDSLEKAFRDACETLRKAVPPTPRD